MKKILLLSLLLTLACQKRSHTGAAISPTPEGGESTEGGGGAFQFYEFYRQSNPISAELVEPTPLDYSGVYEANFSEEELLAKSQEVKDLAFSGLQFLLTLSQRKIFPLSADQVGRIQLAISLTRGPLTMRWQKNLVDRYGTSVWALNSRQLQSITLNPSKWLDQSGERDRENICRNFVPEYDMGAFAFCQMSFDSVVATHEFLSLVGIESDRDFRYSERLIYRY